MLTECEVATRQLVQQWEDSHLDHEALAVSVMTLRKNLSNKEALHNATRERLEAEGGSTYEDEKETQEMRGAVGKRTHA